MYSFIYFVMTKNWRSKTIRWKVSLPQLFIQMKTPERVVPCELAPSNAMQLWKLGAKPHKTLHYPLLFLKLCSSPWNNISCLNFYRFSIFLCDLFYSKNFDWVQVYIFLNFLEFCCSRNMPVLLSIMAFLPVASTVELAAEPIQRSIGMA